VLADVVSLICGAELLVGGRIVAGQPAEAQMRQPDFSALTEF
jgi:hypothetical protein